jgi:cellobiose phosphorylase
VAEEVATLYEHCARALDNSDKLGEHGLPLMGIGDWNDGMNRVGSGGKGESVWDAWFQIVCLRRFALVAQARGDAPRATTCAQRIEKLRQAVETHAWDGAWYRRAYFDDGTPLGSAQNDECQIDSIVQSWAVLSGVADADRARQGMAALRERLVREAERLILLFTPPFDRGSLQPGYIKGYVPGIRENGGQYTHAATWVVLAEAERGRGTEAHHFFDLLNPIRQALTPEAAARFRVEPYALAGDVYGGVHTGRGGWTWYTGSAAWLYRAGLEAILGFRLRGDRLTLRPCIPADWPAFEMDYRHGNTTYAITVRNPRGIETGVTRLVYDGRPVEGDGLILVDDAAKHTVEATLEPA